MVSFDWIKLVGLKGYTSTAALELAVIEAEHTELLHFSLHFFLLPTSLQTAGFFYCL